MGIHVASQDECILSLAELYGFGSIDSIWDHPENAALRQRRANPSLLCAGDKVFIPPLTLKTVTAATGATHRFRVKRLQAKLRLRLITGAEKLADQPFELDVQGVQRRGRTDSSGCLEVVVPASAKRATLRVGEGKVSLELAIGALDPSDEASGVQGRLQNLGFACKVDAEWHPTAVEALRQFQDEAGLPITGEADAATLRKLSALHDGDGR